MFHTYNPFRLPSLAREAFCKSQQVVHDCLQTFNALQKQYWKTVEATRAKMRADEAAAEVNAATAVTAVQVMTMEDAAFRAMVSEVSTAIVKTVSKTGRLLNNCQI